MKQLLDTMYIHGKLLISIVSRGLGESVVHVTKQSGARGGTLLLGSGTAENSILSFLGLGSSEKDVVFTLLDEEKVDGVFSALSACKLEKKKRCGIVMLIDVSAILTHSVGNRTQESQYGEKQRRKTMESPHTLLTCIVNKGLAEEVMEIARKAGATGGTILSARGTGKEEDITFFGVQLVPEKDMLLILVGSDQTGIVLDAVKKAPCLATPGSGIAFCIDVERFMTLGEKKEEH